MSWADAATNSNGCRTNSMKKPLLVDEHISGILRSSYQEIPKSSNVSDEIAYGSGVGLRQIYAAHNEEDFERSMAEEREAEILRTAENIRKVNEVFSEVATLVAGQQDSVNDIENQVSSAAEKTKAGSDQLQKASDHQKTLNSCFVYIFGFLLFVLLIVVVVLFWNNITGSDDARN
jgi:hypothetical protein